MVFEIFVTLVKRKPTLSNARGNFQLYVIVGCILILKMQGYIPNDVQIIGFQDI
jgi:hypothetical protein